MDLALFQTCLAQIKDRMDEYHQYAGVAKTIGVNVKFLNQNKLKKFGLGY